MFVAKWTAENGWNVEGIKPYGTLSMEPAAQILNYGQGLFEGMKAVTSAKGRIVLFRPSENAERMRRGAERMSMADLPAHIFLQGVHELVKANSTHVRRPADNSYLQVRCLLIAFWSSARAVW
jgi:branched-chain amino acid aminotransferase